MKIGMAQLLVEGTEPQRNFERAEKMIVKAKELSCDLVLLPETIDFAWTHPNALTGAEPIPGKYSDLFCNLAKMNSIYVCVGLTEKSENKNYNAAILIDPAGQIIIHYRKINLLEVEFPYYEVGKKLEVVQTPFGKIGLNICADNYLNGLHIGHALAHMGAEIILSPSSWTVDHEISEKNDPYQNKWFTPFSTLAKLYNLTIFGTTSVGYIVGGPYEGKKMVGCSLAVDQNGIIKQGPFNEFSGELIIAEFQVPSRKEKGTQIGDSLIKKGYNFNPSLA